MAEGDNGGREVARHGVRLDALEREVASLRERMHKVEGHAQVITSTARTTTKHEDRIRKLEDRGYWWSGAWAAAGLVAGSVIEWIVGHRG